jgi:hypothetical protein
LTYYQQAWSSTPLGVIPRFPGELARARRGLHTCDFGGSSPSKTKGSQSGSNRGSEKTKAQVRVPASSCSPL